MSARLPGALLVLCWAGSLVAAPARTDHVAYVKQFVEGKLRGTGSGFVIHHDPSGTYVVTNHHVVEGPEGRTFDCVFRSATAKEEVVPMEIAMINPVNDLAILFGPPLSTPAVAVDLAAEQVPAVGDRLRILGYPFGRKLAAEDKNPVVSVTRATIGKFDYGPANSVRGFVLDGSANPGNSGGPVIDEEQRLVGVLVAGVVGTQTVMIIPAARVRELWAGTLSLRGLSVIGGARRRCLIRASGFSSAAFGEVEKARIVALPMSKLPKGADLATFHRLAVSYVDVPERYLREHGPFQFDFEFVLPASEREILMAAIQVTRSDSETLGNPVALPVESPGALAEVATTAKRETTSPAGRPAEGAAASSRRLQVSENGAFRAHTVAVNGRFYGWLDGGRAACFAKNGHVSRIDLETLAEDGAAVLAWNVGSQEVTQADIAKLGEKRSFDVEFESIFAFDDCVVVCSTFSKRKSRRPPRSEIIGAWLHVLDAQLQVKHRFWVRGVVASFGLAPGGENLLAKTSADELIAVNLTSGRVTVLGHARSGGGLWRGRAVELPCDELRDVAVLSAIGKIVVLGDHDLLAFYQITEGRLQPAGNPLPSFLARLPAAERGTAVAMQFGEPVQALLPIELAGGTRIYDVKNDRITGRRLPGAGSLSFDGKTWLCETVQGGVGLLTEIELATDRIQHRELPGELKRVRQLIPHAESHLLVHGEQALTRLTKVGNPAAIATTASEPPPRSLGMADGAEIMELPLDGLGVVDACWSRAGNAVVAWRDGTIRVIEVESFRTVRTAQLNGGCRQLKACSGGLVAATDEGGSRFIRKVDPITLKIEVAMPLPGAAKLASGTFGDTAVYSAGAVLTFHDLTPRGKTTRVKLAREIVATASHGPSDRYWAATTDRLYFFDGAHRQATEVIELRSVQSSEIVKLDVSADGHFLSVTRRDAVEIRGTEDPRIRYRRYPNENLVVFDCRARRVLVHPKRGASIPFADDNRFRTRNRDKHYSFQRALVHPHGNTVLAFGRHAYRITYHSQVFP